MSIAEIGYSSNVTAIQRYMKDVLKQSTSKNEGNSGKHQGTSLSWDRKIYD